MPENRSAKTMSERDLSAVLAQIHQSLRARDYRALLDQLSRAKLVLLQLNALVPSPAVPQSTLLLARELLELAALGSIRLEDYDGFTRYYSQLQPFYDIPSSQLPTERSHRSKIIGLYLLLLLSQGDYAGFHTLLESLELTGTPTASKDARNGLRAAEEDAFIQYPIKLEQWLMEGSYDRVWSATKSEKVPSEEYSIFSDVRTAPLPSLFFCCSLHVFSSNHVFFERKSAANTVCLCFFLTGPRWHHPLGDCLLQRKILLVDSHLQRQESIFP